MPFETILFNPTDDLDNWVADVYLTDSDGERRCISRGTGGQTQEQAMLAATEFITKDGGKNKEICHSVRNAEYGLCFIVGTWKDKGTFFVEHWDSEAGELVEVRLGLSGVSEDVRAIRQHFELLVATYA